MNNTKFDFIPNARKFLEAFVTSNYPQFFQDMGEYKPQSGYGNFSNSSKIVQCMRDITHILEEEFSDLSIPEKFVTSNDLISRARNFIEHLKSFDHYFNESYDIYETKITDIPLPAPINEIDKNRLKTIEAFKEFINLAEQEKEKDKLKSFILSHVKFRFEEIKRAIQDRLYK